MSFLATIGFEDKSGRPVHYLVELDNGRIVSATPVTLPPPPPPSGGGRLKFVDEDASKLTDAITAQAIRELSEATQANSQPPTEPSAGSEGEDKPSPFIIDPTKIDPVFRQRLISIMSDNKYDRQLRNRKRGKIDHKGLWRVSTGANNVFTQKQARKNKDYQIVLIIDQSSSMSSPALPNREVKAQWSHLLAQDDHEGIAELNEEYSLRSYATKVALFLAKHFDEGLNVDLAIVGFGHNYEVIKQLDEVADLEKIERKLQRNRGGTDLFDPLHHTYSRLLRGRNNPIVIVISDGETDDKVAVTRIVRANRHVPTLGIGLMGHRVSVIPDNIMINNIEELKPAMISYLRKKIKRGV